MEYVPLDDDGKVPEGRVPVPGGCEFDGHRKLYYATGKVAKSKFLRLFGTDEDDLILVPGKWGEHLGAVMVAYGESELVVHDGGAVLCWKDDS